MPFPGDAAQLRRASGDAVDFTRTFRFFFEDPDWVKKALVGGLFCLLGVVIVGSLFVAGYVVRMIRRVARGEERPLPEWDDLGGMFGDGLRAAGVYLVYMLPLVLVPLFVALAAVGVFGGTAALAERSQQVAETMGAMLSLVIFGLYALVALAALAMSFYLPSALVRLALLGRFDAALEWRENLAFIQRNLGQYVLALAFYLVASFISQFGVLLCCVGVFPVTFWSLAVLAYGLGHVARADASLVPGP